MCVDAVEKQHMEMSILVERQTKPLDRRDRAGVCRALQSIALFLWLRLLSLRRGSKPRYTPRHGLRLMLIRAFTGDLVTEFPELFVQARFVKEW